MSLRPNALLLLLLTAALAVMGDWSGDALASRLWCLPLALLLLGLAYEAEVTRRAAPQVTVQAAAHWVLGQPAYVRLDIAHRLARALPLEMAVPTPPGVWLEPAVHALPIPGVLALTPTPRRLGRYAWPALHARLGGALSLAWWSRQLVVPLQFQVVPDLLRERQLMPAATAGARAIARAGAGMDILQLRDYRSGDAPRAIDWKATARARHLVSRDFSEDQHLEIVVAVDAGRTSALAAGELDRFALYANVAAKLAQRAASLDDRVGLLIYADRPLASVPPGRGAVAVQRMRAVLAAGETVARDSNPALAALQIRSLMRQRGLVVMLTDLDDPAAVDELATAARLLASKHLPCIAGTVNARIERLAAASVTDELDVYRALAAQEYGRTVAQTLRALQSLGAQAVVAPPSALDVAVLGAYARCRQLRRI